MKSYLLKLTGREEGPYTEVQVAQLFADNRVDRNTPCRVTPDGAWKTIDDVLPMLKYGTQLPSPTSPVVRPEAAPSHIGTTIASQFPASKALAAARVSVVDFDIPFVSIIKLLFKWMAAGFLVFCCFVPAILFLIFVVMAIFGTLLGHLFPSLPRP